MTTFSQLVDSMVAELRRPDMRSEIISYANQTIREMHFSPDSNGSVLYKDNFNEGLVIAASATGFTWDIPDPATFQAMQVVQYMGSGDYAREVTPSRALRDIASFYYRVGNTYVFSGYGGANSQLALGWFEYTRRLSYYAVGSRPAEYDPDLGWSYAPSFDVDEDTRIAAQRFSSNWLILRWVDVLSEGIRAKVYKRLSDTDRSRTCYSMYLSLRMGLVSGEMAAPGGYS